MWCTNCNIWNNVLTARNKATWFINTEPLNTTVHFIAVIFILCWYLRVTVSWDGMPGSLRGHYRHSGRTHWVTRAWRKGYGQRDWEGGDRASEQQTNRSCHFITVFILLLLFYSELVPFSVLIIMPLPSTLRLLFYPEDGSSWFLWNVDNNLLDTIWRHIPQDLLIYLLMELSPSWEAAYCAAIQEIPSNFKEPEGSSPCSQEPSTDPYPEPVWSSPYHPKYLRSILILSTHLRLPSGLFPSGFPTNILYAFLVSPIHATCPVHLTLLDLTSQKTVIIIVTAVRTSNLACSYLIWFFINQFTATNDNLMISKEFGHSTTILVSNV
jgi:hypothetical protein